MREDANFPIFHQLKEAYLSGFARIENNCLHFFVPFYPLQNLFNSLQIDD